MLGFFRGEMPSLLCLKMGPRVLSVLAFLGRPLCCKRCFSKRPVVWFRGFGLFAVSALCGMDGRNSGSASPLPPLFFFPLVFLGAGPGFSSPLLTSCHQEIDLTHPCVCVCVSLSLSDSLSLSLSVCVSFSLSGPAPLCLSVFSSLLRASKVIPRRWELCLRRVTSGETLIETRVATDVRILRPTWLKKRWCTVLEKGDFRYRGE